MLDPEGLHRLLHDVASGALSTEEAAARLSTPPVDTIDGVAELDLHRPLRTGQPEAVFGEGKTADQVIAILQRFAAAGQSTLVTRVTPEVAHAVCTELPAVEWLPTPRLLVQRVGKALAPEGHVVVVAAGTTDLPVAEEAAVTAELLGNRVTRVVDVGVAGLQRILGKLDILRSARVVVVAAGMEGALPSVVAGLVSCPIVAVPTPVGYGASFGGLAALLGMLNSCAPGVSVVNIGNGYGAAVVASRINRSPSP